MSTLRSKLTLVTDFTFHRVALFLRYQRFAIRVLSPCYIGSLSRVHKTWSFSSRRPPSIHGNGGSGGGTARTQGVCNTSVKLVDTRITDRTLHSDGNREKLPSVSFARWWNTASGLLRYLVGNCLFPCLQQDLFWPTFVRTNYILGHIILRLIFQASMTRLFDYVCFDHLSLEDWNKISLFVGGIRIIRFTGKEGRKEDGKYFVLLLFSLRENWSYWAIQKLWLFDYPS